MDNIQLIALSQQTALRRELDIVANNLANVGTPGFRGEHAIFETFVMPIATDASQTGAAADISHVQDVAVFRNFEPGRIELTDNPLDVAIQGEGWFAIETADGERYTRAGRFTLDGGGRLVTIDGDPVLGTGGSITVEPGGTGFAIATDGTVSTSGGEKGALRVVSFADERALVPEGGGLYRSPTPALEPERVRVAQGMLEFANVNPISEITRLIEVTRTYESTARLLSQTSELQQDAIQSLGTIAA